jgi:hypothetical protein
MVLWRISRVVFLNPTYEKPVEANKVFSAAPFLLMNPPLHNHY